MVEVINQSGARIFLGVNLEEIVARGMKRISLRVLSECSLTRTSGLRAVFPQCKLDYKYTCLCILRAMDECFCL